MQSDSCYSCINAEKCFKVVFSQYVNNCIESAFLYDCSNCSYCFGCINLRNKQYHIFNKPYSKEEYFKILKKYNLGSFSQLIELNKKFNDFKLLNPFRFAKVFNSINSYGDHIRRSKNCRNCFDSYETENSKYVYFSGSGLSDSYDVIDTGSKSSLLYEAGGVGLSSYKSSFVNWVLGGREVYYSDLCNNCSNIFGCIGLKNKQYCILNKQYTKEEYEELVPKIIQHMNDMPYVDKKGRVYKYGEFFPSELSLFAYTETIAQEFFSLTKKQITEMGYNWKDSEGRNLESDISYADFPDDIKDLKDNIIGKTILCKDWDDDSEKAQEHNCTKVFKIIEKELAFYKKMNLPLPRLCPNCRHYQRIKQRNPLKLWHRKCQCAGKKSDNEVYKNTIEHFHKTDHCPNEFETTYSSERKEIVYCERCYQQEVV